MNGYGYGYNCPVCRAGFRGGVECSRCGADLGPLMALAARAYRLREAARAALAADDHRAARDLAREAQRLHDTSTGRALLAVAAWGAESLGKGADGHRLDLR